MNIIRLNQPSICAQCCGVLTCALSMVPNKYRLTVYVYYGVLRDTKTFIAPLFLLKL